VKYDFLNVVIQILTLNVYILIGYFARKRELLSSQGSADLSKLLINIIMPLFIFNAFRIEYNPSYLNTMIAMALMVLLYLVVSLLLGKFFAGRFTKTPVDNRTFVYNTVFGNVAFLAFPIIISIFKGQPEAIFFASLFTLVQNLFQWTVGVNLIKPQKNVFASIRNMFQPMLIAILIGLVFYFFRITLPSPVIDISNSLGNMAIPIALIVTGSTLVGFKFSDIIGNKTVQAAALLKTFIFPLVFVIILFFLPLSILGEKMAFMLRTIIVIQVAGPLQASSTAFIKNFGGNDDMTARIVFLSTLYCLVSIPLFLFLSGISSPI